MHRNANEPATQGQSAGSHESSGSQRGGQATYASIIALNGSFELPMRTLPAAGHKRSASKESLEVHVDTDDYQKDPVIGHSTERGGSLAGVGKGKDKAEK